MSYAATIRALKAELLQKAMDALSDGTGGKDAAQLVYAWKQAEAAYPEHRYQVGSKEDPKLRRQVLLECIEGLVEYFTAEDRNVLAAIQPHLRGFATFMEARHAAA